MLEPQGEKDVQQTLDLIDRSLNAPRWKLRFAAPLEAEFETETGSKRAHVLVWQGLVAFIVYNALLFLDFFALSDIFWLAVLIRVGFFGAVIAISSWITWRNPPPFIREGLLALVALAATAGVLTLILVSQSPMRANYHYGIMFVILFVIAIQHLRFWYALPTVLGILVLHAIAVLSITSLSFYDQMAAITLTQALTLFALHTAFSFDRHERQSWLRSLRDRLRAETFEEMAAIDPMTGLGNRRAMQQWLDQLQTERAGAPVSIVVVDIDYFKSYNDTFGHMQGDECIRRISDILASQVRGFGGRAFRFGGEEFVVVLAGHDPEGIFAAADQMRRAVLAAHMPHKSSTGTGFVTCSFGHASDVLDPGIIMDALLTEADYALYAAKRAGRNRVMPELVEPEMLELADSEALELAEPETFRQRAAS